MKMYFLYLEDWIRPISKKDKHVLVHWWYFPDRYIGYFYRLNIKTSKK